MGITARQSTCKRTSARPLSAWISAPFLLLVSIFVFAALPSVGTTIGNQAIAQYEDATGKIQTVTSNLVQTVVQQVAGVSAGPQLTQSGAPGNPVTIPFTVENNGNGPDSYDLIANQPGGDDFTCVAPSPQIFADANQDGVADNSTPLSNTGVILADDQATFVMVCDVPATGVTSGNTADVEITTTSTFDPTQTTTFVDTVVVDDTAFVVTKEMSVTSGPVGTSGIVVTLRYRNAGTVAADLRVIDVLPAGMVYTPDSGRWSQDATVVLTDVAGDNELLAGIDYNAISNTVTAILDNLAPGDEGSVTFLVSIGGTAAVDTTLINQADFDDGAGGSGGQTNGVPFEVTPDVGLSFQDTGDANDGDDDGAQNGVVLQNTAPQGAVIEFVNVITNTGNGVDTFDLQNIDISGFPANTSQPILLTQDGVPLTDSDAPATAGFGLPDTGPLQPGEEFRVVVRVQLPPDVGGAGPFDFTTAATSTINPGVSATLINRLGAIGASQVDLTAIAPVTAASGACDSATDACGFGPGVVGQVIESQTQNASTAPLNFYFPLYVNNTNAVGGNSDTFALSTESLLPNWVVTYYRDPNGVDDGNDGIFDNDAQVATTTSDISAGEYELIWAQVTVPAGAPVTSDAVGFRIASALTGATDVLYDEVNIVAVPALGTVELVKQASVSTAEVGDVVSYTLRVRNLGAPADLITNLQLRDVLPFGFSLQANSVSVDSGQVLVSGAPGPIVTFTLDQLPGGATAVIRYRLAIGPGALQGDGTNTASPNAPIAGNTATATVIVTPGVFTNRGYINGTVYSECSFDRENGHEELGIPGVRVYMENGTFAITDAEGKFSFVGVSPRTHVLRLDPVTLPDGAEIKAMSNRHGGDGNSVFVDLHAGQLAVINFADGGCSDWVIEQIKARRERGEVFRAEVGNVFDRQLNLNEPAVDPRTLPAASDNRNTYVGQRLQVAKGENAAITEPDAKPTVPVDLEKMLAGLDPSFGFVGVKNGDIVAGRRVDLIIKGPGDTSFVLDINGERVSASRIGQKSVAADGSVQLWEFTAVRLDAGENILEARLMGPFEIVRGNQQITITAPAEPAALTLTVPDAPVADGVTTTQIQVTLNDATGVKVNARTPITLEASAGQWQVTDLDPLEPGVQVFVENGVGVYSLLSPQQAQDVFVRARTGLSVTEAEVRFVPEMRDMIAVGFVEGSIRLGDKIQPTRKQDGFQQQLANFARDDDEGERQMGARGALFLKGKVLGQYLLTASYDSEKDPEDRLFRDIRPDEFYPVYGDSALKGFDAQSTSKLYVRVDGQQSYLMYGDYDTQSDYMPLGVARYSRSLNGARYHLGSKWVDLNLYASHDRLSQNVEILDAQGISGPYQLPDNIVPNSEKVEIFLRDRVQPSLEITNVPDTHPLSDIIGTLQRFSDYQLEPTTGRLFFRRPIPSLDADLNPVYIRVTYETESSGERYWIGGFDGRLKLGDSVTISANYAEDRNPAAKYKLHGVGAQVNLTERTKILAEYSLSEDQSLAPDAQDGEAARVEFRHDGSRMQLRVHAARADEDFSNRNSSVQQGREEVGARFSLKLWEGGNLTGEGFWSRGTSDNPPANSTFEQQRRRGVAVGIEQRLGDSLKVELGFRRSIEDATALSSELDVESVRARVTAGVPFLEDANVFVEYEQDVRDSTRRVLALGGDYYFAGKARVYARHEAISSLDSRFGLNDTERRHNTVVGVDTEYVENGRLFSEYRMRDAISGREAEAAMGLRNFWDLGAGVRMNASFEQIQTLRGEQDVDSTAVSLGFDYTGNPLWKMSTRFEARRSKEDDSLLNSIGLGRKLSRSWVMLVRNIFTLNRDRVTGDNRIDDRLQIGFAYRSTDSSFFNAMARYELDYSADDVNQERALAHIVSLHMAVRPTENVTLSGRYAGKRNKQSVPLTGTTSYDYTTTHLTSVRATYDIGERWDVGFSGSAMFSEDAIDYGLGVEVGFLLYANLWLSAGYNVFGYDADELADINDYTNKGGYVSFRYKFDETLFSGGDPLVNNSLPRE